MSLVNPPPNQNPVVGSDGKATQFWQKWFISLGSVIGLDLAYYPPTLADVDANNNSVYYSSTLGKLTYKDPSGVPHALY